MAVRLISMLWLTLALVENLYADVSLEYCSISCRDGNVHGGAIGPVRQIGAPGKRGHVGPKGAQGPIGPQGPVGSPGSPCDCYDLTAQIEELKVSVTRLETAVIGEDWRRMSNGLWYRLFETKVNYEQAKTNCQSNSAHLATVGMRDPTIRGEIMSAFEFTTYTFIGLDDIAQDGTYVWNDGVASTPENTDWAPNEPNGGTRENCVEIHPRRNLKMNDYLCSATAHYLCETD